MSEPSYPPNRSAPPAVIIEHGSHRFGTYDGPIPNVNPHEVSGGRVARALRSTRLKEWEAFQLGDDDWFVLGAVYDAKAMGLLQVLAVDKQRATITRWQAQVPSPRVNVARGLSGTRSHGHSGGFTITIGNELAAGRLHVDASHPGRRDLAPLELHGTGLCPPDETGHLVIVHPFTDDQALYSHKAIMPFEGSLRIGSDRVGFDPDRGFLILDDHHGEYPRPQRYDWVTGVRRAPDGRVEGFNLTDNQVRDPDVHNENALWIGSDVHRLPAITVDRPKGPWEPWHVHDRHGAVDVRFTPTVRSALHVGPRRSLAEYYAPYGWFEGTIEAEHARLDLDGFFGVGEQKLIRI